MTVDELTDRVPLAKTLPMQGTRAGHGSTIGAAVVLASFALGGCVTVKAPSEPIVIELNVNIRQEVIYRLAEDAGNTVQNNQDIF